MTRQEATEIVKRKARYALQTQFNTVILPADIDAVITENSWIEPVVLTEGAVATDTVVYDVNQAAVQLLEMVAPFAPQAKSIGSLSVTYENIQNAIERLKRSRVSMIRLGRYPQETGAQGSDEAL